MLCLLQLACAASPTPTQDAREHVREQVLIDLDPGGLIWTGLDVDDDLALLIGIVPVLAGLKVPELKVLYDTGWFVGFGLSFVAYAVGMKATGRAEEA